MADMSELLAVVGRLGRAMPRHPDVIELERVVTDLFAAKNLERPKKGPFDKRSYQRELMRKIRAEKRRREDKRVEQVPTNDLDGVVTAIPKGSMTKEERLEWLKSILPERLQEKPKPEEPNPFE